MRDDWENVPGGDELAVKEQVMLQAPRLKFGQDPRFAALLKATGAAMLIEHTDHDPYWGDGKNGNGRNRLRHLLMRVRDEIEVPDLACAFDIADNIPDFAASDR